MIITNIVIDQQVCIGCGTCWVGHPQLFTETQCEGEFKAAPTGVINVDDERLRMIADMCPTYAIHLLAADGSVVFPTTAQCTARTRAVDW